MVRPTMARTDKDHGGVSPILIGAATVLVALVVAVVALRAGGSNEPLNAGGQTIDTVAPPSGGACGVGQPDPSYGVAVDSSPNPPKPDGTTFHLAVSHDGTAVTGAKVCLTADMTDMQHAGVSDVSKEAAAGVYDATINFGMGGAWSAAVTIAEPGKPVVTVPVKFQVALS
ncbi:MAG: FixH family protein [Actinomycetota bacterium]|nr:FixH family protein [Actinomycetota bacterium]